MASISAATAQQAESYISTIALFILFSHSPKESKVSMKLPATWKEVWAELYESKKEVEDAADRETVKNIKNIVQEVRSQVDDDVVLTGNFKRRNGNGTNGRPEETLQHTQKDIPSEESLQRLWTDRSSTASFKQMLTTRMSLPITPFKESILETLTSNQAIIICSETGSGKSTQIPSFILENELMAGRPCKIYVTEPRRISAVSLAKRVSEELGEGKDAVGTNRSLVGYSIRLESKITNSTRLIFAYVLLHALSLSQWLMRALVLLVSLFECWSGRRTSRTSHI